MLTAGTVVAKFKADITEFKQGIESMKKSTSDYSGSVEFLQKKLEIAKQKLEELKNKTNSSSSSIMSAELNVKKYANSLAEATKKEFFESIDNIKNSFKKLGDELKSVFAVLSAGVGILTIAGKKWLDLAGDAAETKNKFNAVFGDMTNKAEEYVNTVSNGVGRNETDLRNGLAAFQGFAQGLNMSKEEAFKFSTTLQSLSLDFASFNNLSDAEAQERFISAMSGSSEVLDMFGINIKASALDQELLNMGINKTTATATENEKVMARLNIIMQSMGRQGAIGDAEKTMGSYANTVKRTQAEMKTLQEEIGTNLIPVVTPLLEKFREFIASITPEQIQIFTNALIELGGKILSITQFIWDHKEGILELIVAYKALQIAMSFGELIKSITDLFTKENIELLKKIATLALAEAEYIIFNATLIATSIAEGLVTTATWLLNTALAVLTSPITLVVLAIGALIAIGVLLYKNWDTISEKLKQFGEFLKNKFLEIIGWVKNNWQTIIAVLTGPIGLVWLAWQKFGDDIKGWFGEMWNNTKEWGSHMMENFVNGIKAGIEKVKGTINDIKNWITENLGFSKNKYLPSEVWGLHFVENFTDGINNGMNQLGSGIDSMMNGLDLSSQLNLQGAGSGGGEKIINQSGSNIVQNNNFYGTTIDDSAVNKVMTDGAWKLRNLR